MEINNTTKPHTMPKLSKDLGDFGDTICTVDVFIYHIPGVKVGSTYNLESRLKAQGYTRDDAEVLYRIIANTSSFNHIWSMEQVTARQYGFRDEHQGQRKAVNRLRASRKVRYVRAYVLTQVNAPCAFYVEEPGQFEVLNGLLQGSLSRAANPNTDSKYIILNGSKFTARYAE
jgi:hypothetical protein